MENCKCVATALNNIAALNWSGAIDKGQREKVVMDYFQEYDRTILALSDYENVSDDVNQSDLTERANQDVQTKWKRHRTSYLLKGVAVCGEAFIHVYG